MDKLIKSDQYGNVVWTKIAIMRFSPEPIPGLSDEEICAIVEKLMKWSDKYHPKNFFGSYMCDTLRPDLPIYTSDLTKCQQAHPYELWVAIKEKNTDWAKENKTTAPYFTEHESTKRVRVLPISVTQKEVDQWLEASEKLGLIDEVL